MLQELELIRSTAPSTFCAPHYIEELRCDGLTAEEIAASLGAHVDKVREKLRTWDSQTLKSLKLLTRRMKNINGVEYNEFFLSTAAAKFFVARYENDIGDGYLEYLIRLDMAVEERCRKYEQAYLELSKKHTLALRAHEDIGNEPVTDDEMDLLNRVANANLKRQGRMRSAYKKGFRYEIIQKFFLPGEDKGTYSYLPRKNFKAALSHARNREFNLATFKEFVE